MNFYKKKVVTIEAKQWNGTVESAKQIKDWVESGGQSVVLILTDEITEFAILTSSGKADIIKSDYIIKGVEGEFYPCHERIFKKTYEKVNK